MTRGLPWNHVVQTSYLCFVVVSHTLRLFQTRIFIFLNGENVNISVISLCDFKGINLRKFPIISFLIISVCPLIIKIVLMTENLPDLTNFGSKNLE